jgi:hypothetical protein
MHRYLVIPEFAAGHYKPVIPEFAAGKYPGSPKTEATFLNMARG